MDDTTTNEEIILDLIVVLIPPHQVTVFHQQRDLIPAQHLFKLQIHTKAGCATLTYEC